jgi:hypothetical protein
MAEAWLHRQLCPEELAHGVRLESRPEFLGRFGDTYFLLVNLKATDPELEATLLATAPMGAMGLAVRKSSDPMGFNTVLQSNTSDAPPSFVRRSSVFEPNMLTVKLVHSRLFAVPLRKRPSTNSPSADRISLGRALNRDIVLRHSSVSKFHGWFEMDERGNFYYQDAGSRNGTKLNGDKLPSREPRCLEPGDTLAFGSVQALLCPPETLWDAFHL